LLTLAPSRNDLTVSQEDLGELLICFSHLRWSFVYQRPQHLLTRAARRRPVLFFEEPEVCQVAAPRLRLEREGALTRIWAEVPPGTPAEQVEAVQQVALQGVMAQRPERRLLAWYYTPMALTWSDPGAFDCVAYDCMDELSAFHGADSRLRRLEAQLLQAADVVFAGGRSLWEAKRAQRPDVLLEPSSVDAAHFRQARAGLPDPISQAGVSRPRIGWFGVIDERMDLDLVAEAARARPDWSFIMLGPVLKIDPASLPQADNLHWLGCQPYAALPAHLAHWDVGFMPFALNAATRFISPTKTLEYLAAGVPLASTAVADVVSPYGEAGLVEIVRDAPEMLAAVERLLARPKPGWLERVDAMLARQSWDGVWRRMETALAAGNSLRTAAQ